MSTSAKDILQRHRLSVDEYHRMARAGILPEDSRVELINGEIIDMAPIGSRHAAAVKQLTRILNRTVGDTAIVSVQDPIHLDPHTEPQPDLALLRPREDFYKTAHPRASDVLLVIEVADHSLRYDREIKIPLYARHGISEVWLVDLQSNRISLFREGTAEGYRRESEATDLERLSPLHLPQAIFDLCELW
ncbi:MAG: Uma2 family endonuclease [Gammaproteobacteria bacterium]|nr:Uma2 family endonuclease [Gammaproteobacteria bacterium]